MSLTNLTTKTPYAGNGVTTVFPFTFKVFDPTHLVVTETVTATGVTTTLVLNTDYTVTGVGLDAGGSITRASAPPTGTTGLIRRVMPLTQTADIRNQSAFYASVHEDVFDKLTMVDQQQEEEIGRSLQIPEQYSVGVSNQLPAPVASTAIGWNAAGTGLANFLIPGVTPTYVVTFNGRSGAVVPAANDYSFAQLSGAASSAQIAAALTTPGPIGGTTASTISGTTITASTQFTGPGTGLTGTAASLTAGNATKLATAITIQGVSFDGSANITLPTFVGSGASHAAGLVPDPGSSAGAVRKLREDGTWAYDPYDIGFGCTGKPAASAVILRFPVVRDISLPTSLTGSQGKAGTAATSSATFNIAKNGTNIGTMVFAASGTVPTWTCTATTAAPGDIITVTAPGTQDATLADISAVLALLLAA